MVTKAIAAVTKGKAATANEDAEHAANCALHAGVSAAAVIEAYAKTMIGEQDLNCLVESLSKFMIKINDGSLVRVENMLIGQAHALQSMFVNLARRAVVQEGMHNFETHMKLAFKAQSQCRATLETLASIKNPPVVFAKQANMTTGPMQVNNGTVTPRTQEKEIEQSKLLEMQHGNYLDTPTAGATVGSYQEVEAVGAIHGAEVGRR